MSENPSDRSVLFDPGGIADWLTGIGILVLALAPLAIPALLLTAVLAAPLVLIGAVPVLPAALAAGPVLAIRRVRNPAGAGRGGRPGRASSSAMAPWHGSSADRLEMNHANPTRKGEHDASIRSRG